MVKISWTDRVRNEVLHRAKERNIIHIIKRRNANWIGCFLEHIIEGKIEGRSDRKTRKMM